ncbi:thrombospondin type-1 domain-containing protein 7B, partial [Caerostris extrusa]
IEEWSPCVVPEDNYVNQLQSDEEIQISFCDIGISTRNITCVTADGDAIDLRYVIYDTAFCNVAESPVLERQCVVTVHCLTSPGVNGGEEGRLHLIGWNGIFRNPDSNPPSDTDARGPRVDTLPPTLRGERIILYDLPECYKYQWLPLEWSDCEVRLHGYHGEVTTVHPTCGSGLQYRNLICVRATETATVFPFASYIGNATFYVTDLNRLSSFPAIRGYMSSFHAEARKLSISHALMATME